MTKIKYSILTGLVISITLSLYFHFKMNMPANVSILTVVVCIIPCSLIAYLKFFAKMNTDVVFERKIDPQHIVYSCMVSHYKYGINVGGTLYISKDELVFQTNLASFMKKHELILNTSEIKEVGLNKTLGLFNNGLFITTHNGITEQFVVNKRKICKEQIEAVLTGVEYSANLL